MQLPTPPRPQFLLRAPRKARLSPAPPPPGFTSPPPSGVGCGGAGLDLNSAPPPGTPMGGGRGASGGSSNGAPGAALREPPPPPGCRLHACAGLRGWGRAVPLRPRAEPSSRYPREGRGLAPAGGGGASTGGAPEWNAVGTQRGSGPQEGGVGRKRPLVVNALTLPTSAWGRGWLGGSLEGGEGSCGSAELGLGWGGPACSGHLLLRGEDADVTRCLESKRRGPGVAGVGWARCSGRSGKGSGGGPSATLAGSRGENRSSLRAGRARVGAPAPEAGLRCTPEGSRSACLDALSLGSRPRVPANPEENPFI